MALFCCQQHNKKEEIDVGQEIYGLQSLSEKKHIWNRSADRLKYYKRRKLRITFKDGENSKELQRFYNKASPYNYKNIA